MDTKRLILGRNPVLEYLKTCSDPRDTELSVSENAHGRIINTIIEEAERRKVPITFQDRKFFSSLGSSTRHQGVALTLPEGESLSTETDLISRVKESGGVLVLLDHLTDPHNVGSIIRTAEALGATGIIMPKAQSAALTPTVVKASAGATAHIEVLQVGNLASYIEETKKKGIWIIGTSDHGGSDPGDLKNRLPALLVIGCEGKGMHRLTEEKCDLVVKIPLKGKVSSLNASVAAGILLYELLKG